MSTTAGPDPSPDSQARGSKTQSVLAFALGSVVSGTLAYYVAASRSDTSNTNTDFNTQYGSPDDFKKAIQELQEAFCDDEDAVSTDTDELERHGMANFAMHPGWCRPSFVAQ